MWGCLCWPAGCACARSCELELLHAIRSVIEECDGVGSRETHAANPELVGCVACECAPFTPRAGRCRLHHAHIHFPLVAVADEQGGAIRVELDGGWSTREFGECLPWRHLVTTQRVASHCIVYRQTGSLHVGARVLRTKGKQRLGLWTRLYLRHTRLNCNRGEGTH